MYLADIQQGRQEDIVAVVVDKDSDKLKTIQITVIYSFFFQSYTIHESIAYVLNSARILFNT